MQDALVLPNDINELKKLVLLKNNALKEKTEQLSKKTDLLEKTIEKLKKYYQENNELHELVLTLRRLNFAPKSEVVSSEQLGLFNELEEIVADDTEEEVIKVPAHERKKRGKRKKLPDYLPRVKKVIDLSDDEKSCPNDGSELVKIGEKVTEQLNFVPAHIEVIQTVRPQYACPSCDNGLKIMPLPPMLLPKTMATPSLIAFIIVSKFADYLPLYRQEHIFERIGIDLPRSTMARWLIKVCDQLMPLYNLLEEMLLEVFYMQMDESHTQVLKEKNKKATSKSYMWARVKPYGEKIILFDYDPTRSGEVPKRLLGDYNGYLQADGYSGYDAICTDNKITRLGCMNHCRSKFEKAYKSSNNKKVGKKGLILLKKLYKIEEKIKNHDPPHRYNIRLEQSKPILDEMKQWVDEMRPKITPKSLAGKAINYAYNQWIYLTNFLKDGRLEMTNIITENAFRPFALGRKNFLFSNSVDGAHASAMFYSLTETAKANGLEPLDYFNRMLEKLPYAKTVDDFEKLLPLMSKFDPSSIHIPP